MIRFHNGTPVGMYFSQHVDGEAYQWDDSTLSKTNDGRVCALIIYFSLNDCADSY